MKQTCSSSAALATTLLLAACAPNIRLSTPEPVKIDVAMKVEIVQKPSAEPAGGAIATSRRSRMTEIQQLKNNSILGENARGYLTVHTISPDWLPHRAYIEKLVRDENVDRELLYAQSARESGKSMKQVEKEFAELFRQNAFLGELVEVSEGDWQKK